MGSKITGKRACWLEMGSSLDSSLRVLSMLLASSCVAKLTATAWLDINTVLGGAHGADIKTKRDVQARSSISL